MEKMEIPKNCAKKCGNLNKTSIDRNGPNIKANIIVNSTFFYSVFCTCVLYFVVMTFI